MGHEPYIELFWINSYFNRVVEGTRQPLGNEQVLNLKQNNYDNNTPRFAEG